MKLELKDVPYRRWGRGKMFGKIVDCPEGKRVMDLIGREMKAGRDVEFWQSQPFGNGEKDGKRVPHRTGIYDTISVIIHD